MELVFSLFRTVRIRVTSQLIRVQGSGLGFRVSGSFRL